MRKWVHWRPQKYFRVFIGQNLKLLAQGLTRAAKTETKQLTDFNALTHLNW